MFIWQSVYVQSSSPRACLYNPEHCLIMFHTELPLQFHTVFNSQDRSSCLLAGQAHFLQTGYSLWAAQMAWPEQIVLTCDQAGLSRLLDGGESIKKKLEDVTCHFGTFSFLDWPLSVLLSVLFLIWFSGALQRRVCFLQLYCSSNLADSTPHFRVAEIAVRNAEMHIVISQMCPSVVCCQSGETG